MSVVSVSVNRKESFTPEQLAIVEAAAMRHKERAHQRRVAIRGMAQKVMIGVFTESILELGAVEPEHYEDLQVEAAKVVVECTKIYDAIGDAKIEDRTHAYP